MIASTDLAVFVDRRALRITRVFTFHFAYTSSALTWFDYSNCATFHPYLWWYLLTQQYVQRCTCACYGTLSDFPYSITYLSRWRAEGALWRNRLEFFRYSIACISCWLSREAPGRNCLVASRYNITGLLRWLSREAPWRDCLDMTKLTA